MPDLTPPRIDVRLDDSRAGARIAHVTIDNRARLNSMGSALMEQFVAAFDELGKDESLRAVVLRGAGEKAFVGGADIDEMAAIDGERRGREFITRVHRVCHAVREIGVPVIARLHGFTLGAGLELAAACDLRVAADDARFGMPEVRLGIPSVVEAALLPGLIGWGRARQMLLLGDTYGAAEMADWGLLEFVEPHDAMDACIERCLTSILACGPQALRQQKALIRQWENLPMRDAVKAGIDAFAASWRTDEPSRMMTAFRTQKKAHKG